MTFERWLAFVHVAGAFLFVFGHGASAMVLFRLRRTTSATQVRDLLELSKSAFPATYIGALLLLIGGIWAGIEGGLWTVGFNWLWAAVIVLIVVIVAMFMLISRHFYKWRELLIADSPADEAALMAEVHGPQPIYGAIVGLVGITIILYLMMAKPF